MTKCRRKKINSNMSYKAYKYVEKGRFAYLLKQSALYRKHASYLSKMHRREWKRRIKVYKEDCK